MVEELQQIDTSAIEELCKIKHEQEILDERLQKMEEKKDAVSDVVYAKVREDYETRNQVFEDEARPRKEKARTEFAKLRILNEQFEAALHAQLVHGHAEPGSAQRPVAHLHAAEDQEGRDEGQGDVGPRDGRDHVEPQEPGEGGADDGVEAEGGGGPDQHPQTHGDAEAGGRGVGPRELEDLGADASPKIVHGSSRGGRHRGRSSQRITRRVCSQEMRAESTKPR